MKLISVVLLAAALIVPAGTLAQDKPADNTQILLEKVRADKRFLVATNMTLTDEEAKGFWPVYDAFQQELQQINGRLEKAIKAYADVYKQGSVPDATAKQLLDEALAIEEAEVQLKRSYVPKLGKALPMSKVARYLQIETKIRSAIRNEMAAGIPLVH